MVCVRLSLFLTVIPFRYSNHIFYFSPVYRVHLSCFCNNRSVVLYSRTPSVYLHHFAKCCFIQSKGADAYMLLKLYISSTFNHAPTVTMNKSCRFFTLDTPSICTYHLLDRSTQQKSCEVEIAIFPDIFMTQQTAAK